MNPETPRQSAALLAFAAALALLALWTFAEYLPAFGWAGVIAIATWPTYQRFRKGAGTAALFAIGVGLVFLAPIVGAGYALSLEAEAALKWLEEVRRTGIALPANLDHLPLIGAALATWWRANLTDPQSVADLIRGFDKAPLMAMSSHIGAGLARRLVTFLFTILALFFLYRDGEALTGHLYRLAERAFGPRGPAMGVRIAHSVQGTVDGLVLVGLGEGAILTVAYYFAGVPQVALMGVATAIGAIIPFGAFVMFSLASLLLVYKGAMAGAVAVFVAGLAVLTLADHVVRPFVIGSATRMSFLLVLVGILGGVETFGMLGLFLGPAIMAVLTDLWREATE